MENVENFKVTALKNFYEITLNDVLQMKMEKDDPVSIFIQSIIKMKTDVNYHFEEKRCKEEGIEFDSKNVKIGRFQPSAFLMIGAIKIFAQRFSEGRSNDLYKYIEAKLLKNKDDLFYFKLNVLVEENDIKKINDILDALCVKFYQTMIFAAHEFFNVNKQILIISPIEKGYRFEFRPMNIIELENLQKGKMTINSQK